MIVLRATMDAALEKERQHYRELSVRFGQALHATAALQQQIADWITDKGEALTPEQAAALFYSHDDRWQAAFFNVLSSVVEAHHAAMPPARPGEFRPGPGFPAGEGQWWYVAQHLDDSGFETLEAMYDHARYARLNSGKRVGELLNPPTDQKEFA